MNNLAIKNDKSKNHIPIILIITGAILLIPLIGMQLSSSWNWSLFDFAIMVILIFGSLSIADFLNNKVKDKKQKYILLGLVLLAFLFIWAELAVGVFTNLGS